MLLSQPKGHSSMKPIMTVSLYLVMVAVFLTLGLPGPLAAKEQVPFKGSVQGREIDLFQGPPPGTLAVKGSGTGLATHLGQRTVTWNLTVNLADGTGAGSAHYIAANGDSIFTTVVGQSEPTGTPGVFHITEIQIVTGGTGRFAGAKGSFTLERLIDFPTLLSSGSFHGTITSPGAAH